VSIADPLLLWNRFKDALCDDLPYYLAAGHIAVPENAQDGMRNVHYDYGLYLIQQLLLEFNKSLPDFELPVPVLYWNPQCQRSYNSLIAEEQSHSLSMQT